MQNSLIVAARVDADRFGVAHHQGVSVDEADFCVEAGDALIWRGRVRARLKNKLVVQESGYLASVDVWRRDYNCVAAGIQAKISLQDIVLSVPRLTFNADETRHAKLTR